MNNRKHAMLDRYLIKLRRSLRHLSEADRDDIVKEIESHIQESWETSSNGNFDDESLKGILKRMGAPEMIGAQYCQQRGWAIPPRSHTLRNVILTLVALFLLGVFVFSYLGMRYFVYPIAQYVGGDKKIIKIDDSGIELLGGAISIKDDDVVEDGISIGGKASFSPTLKESDSFTVPASGLSTLIIDTKNGHLSIIGAETENIEVTYTKKIYDEDKDDARKMLSGMELQKETSSSTLKLKSFFPEERWSKWSSRMSIDIDVKLPRRFAAKIDVRNGMIEVAGISGKLEIDSRNGNLNVKDVGSSVLVDMRNGNVDLSEVGGDVELDMRMGNVTVDGVKGNVDLDSRMGSIDLVLGSDYDFSFLGEVDLGSITCDFPTKKNGDQIYAKVGQGSHDVRVFSKMGSVNVKIDK